jgi:hypothetical protein
MTTATSEAIPATVPASDELLTAVMEAIRCTAFIPEPDIRAKYVITDLRLRDVIVTVRGPGGRFLKAAR